MYRHILIGLNQSDAAHRALRRAIDIAIRFNATLTVMAVVPALPPFAAYASALGSEALQIMSDDKQAEFVELLEMARREASQHSIEIETALSGGSVEVSLFEAVKMNHVDLLVLGIHPELPGWLSGTTVNELAQKTVCDVLGVH